MSVRPPPFPNVNRFNNLYWITSDTGGLTESQADLLYLKFPNAQGTENLVATNVNGALTATGTASFTNAAPPTSTATQPASNDSSTKIPTTAWVQTAVAGGSTPNLLPLNNTWTGTNQFNNQVSGVRSSQGQTNLVLTESTSTKNTSYIANASSGFLNGVVVAGDSAIIAGSNTIDANILTLSTWANEKVGVRLTGTSATIGAGGVGGSNPTSSLSCQGTAATLTGDLAITGVPTTTSVQPASNDSSTKIPTTAWVQGAIGAGGGLKQVFTYQFFNSPTTTPSSTSVQMIVPFVNLPNFSWFIRLEVNYALYANGNTTSASDPRLLSQIVGNSGQTNINPNTQAIVDLTFAGALRSVIAQSTSSALTTIQNYFPTNIVGPYAYTPFTSSIVNSSPNTSSSTITLTFGFPAVPYTSSPNYTGNITSAAVSVRILTSMTSATSTPTSTSYSSGIAYFV
jgi:hypothetical protein